MLPLLPVPPAAPERDAQSASNSNVCGSRRSDAGGLVLGSVEGVDDRLWVPECLDDEIDGFIECFKNLGVVDAEHEPAS